MSLVLDTGAMKYRENPSQPWRPLVIKANMNWESLADTYDPDNGTYEVGQYVLEDGTFYRCISEINTPETWTAAHWISVNIGDELFSLQGSIASEATTRASEDTLIRNTLTQDEAGLAIPKTGPTANTALGAGTYIHLTESGNNNLPDGFYQVKSGGISQGETYTTNNLTTLSAVNGFLNYIGSSVNAITPGTNSITVSAGGYIKIGKLVFLGVRIGISSSIAKNDVIFTGLPPNAGSFIPFFQMSDGYDFAHYSCRLNAGKMYADSSIPSGISLNVQGFYISA